jgi:hypothetical protein
LERLLSVSSGGAATAGRFSDHSSNDTAPWRQSRDDGVVGDGPARAAVRSNRRRGADDLVEHARQQLDPVQFDLNRNIDAAAQDILTAIDIPLQFFDRRRVDRPKGKIATVRQAPHRAVGPQGLALRYRPDRSVDNHRQHFGEGGLTDRRVHSAKVKPIGDFAWRDER